MNSVFPAPDSFLARLARQAAQLSEAAAGEIALLQGDLACTVASDGTGFHHVRWQGTALESILSKPGFTTLKRNGTPLPPRLVPLLPAPRPLVCTGVNLKDERGLALGGVMVYYTTEFQPAASHQAALSGLAGLIEVWIRELVTPRNEAPSWVNSPDPGLPSFRCTLTLDGRILETGPGWQGAIELTCCIQDQGDLIISIHDNGRPFDPSTVPDPPIGADLENLPEGGLGLYFMRRLMDQVTFQFDEQNGNVLTMVKRRHR